MTSLLIVDDAEDYLGALTRALSSRWQVVAARSYDEAVQALAAHAPPVALVDVRLSETDPENADGLKVLQWLRAHQPGVKVVMMSAYRDFDIAVNALNAGATAFLKKPIDLRELKALLQSLVQSSA
jgi:DNA-binding NtrC family response regulator